MPDYYMCVWYNADFQYESGFSRRRLDMNDFTIFKLANDPTCAVGNREGYCSEIDYEASQDSPPELAGATNDFDIFDFPAFNQNENWTQFTMPQFYDYYFDEAFYPIQLAETMDFSFFNHMNLLREDPEQFVEDNTDEFEYHPTALYDIAGYMDDLEPLNWNRALANTARHLVNDMGACGTTGDVNSD